MTDEQIKKALECCKGGFCCGCPRLSNNMVTVDCMRELINDTLDLINRQQETIETLRSCVEQHHIMRKDGKSPLSLLTKEIKAEAIKECLDRIEVFLCDVCGSVVEDNRNLDRILFGYNTEEVDAFIDNLRKEMVGEQE